MVKQLKTKEPMNMVNSIYNEQVSKLENAITNEINNTNITAMDVANYIVNYSNSQNSPVSNLKLQKLLFFAWIEYYKQTQKYLFHENFYAWRLGPVVPNVYYEFCVYGGFSIFYDAPNSQLQDCERIAIEAVIKKYFNKTSAQLVTETHRPGRAWDKNYVENKRCMIPFDDVIALECGA